MFDIILFQSAVSLSQTSIASSIPSSIRHAESDGVRSILADKPRVLGDRFPPPPKGILVRSKNKFIWLCQYNFLGKSRSRSLGVM